MNTWLGAWALLATAAAALLYLTNRRLLEMATRNAEQKAVLDSKLGQLFPALTNVLARAKHALEIAQQNTPEELDFSGDIENTDAALNALAAFGSGLPPDAATVPAPTIPDPAPDTSGAAQAAADAGATVPIPDA